MGDSPLLMSEELVKATNAVRQADSGFGGRCLIKSREVPLRPYSPLPVGPLNLMTFATGGTPHAGSQHPGMGEPGGLLSLGSTESDMTEVT